MTVIFWRRRSKRWARHRVRLGIWREALGVQAQAQHIHRCLQQRRIGPGQQVRHYAVGGNQVYQYLNFDQSKGFNEVTAHLLPEHFLPWKKRPRPLFP
ncbi:hypothetical protein [Polaromonas sp.]|uniref:hypothetical protein n=1 Tax=Polaromonas sp. TaxID=1869339 RepID=UPI003FA78CA1